MRLLGKEPYLPNDIVLEAIQVSGTSVQYLE
jgi:hypothetical protein